MLKPTFVNDSIYHIYNRGVEKRMVYLDQRDYFRFIHDLYEFNDEISAENIYYKQKALKSYEVEPRKISSRKILLEIIAFCLMPNHFHLMVRQHIEGGIIKFMQKLGTGYTMYFNTKYDRVGALFQGRFKAAEVKTHEHFLYLPHYIHLNPLDVIQKSKSYEVEPRKTVVRWKLKFLASYRWSSYLDFVGKKNFPSLLSHNLIRELYGTSKEYKQSLREWLDENKDNELLDVIFDE